MLYNMKLYLQTIFRFTTWFLKPSAKDLNSCLELKGFSYLVRIFRVENLQEPKLFNYFYLARYFFGYPAKVFFVKKYFILGRTYYNIELGFSLPFSRLPGPLTV